MGLAVAVLIALQAPAVEPAVEKGTRFLKAHAADLREPGLWTLVTVGVSENDPLVQRLLQDMLARPLDTTPAVALQAMILRDLDAVRYRNRIAHCAQFLVDNQAADGRWDAGRPVEAPEVPRLAEGALPSLSKVTVAKRSGGRETGDSVHSRWAAWGLLACDGAGFVAPAEVLDKASASWRTGEHDAVDVVTSLSIHLHLRGRDWRKDPDVLKGVERLADPARPSDPASLFLQLRAMRHFGDETPGARGWWAAKARLLLAAQAPDGGWGGVDETCAAVHFLHRLRMKPMREARR